MNTNCLSAAEREFHLVVLCLTDAFGEILVFLFSLSSFLCMCICVYIYIYMYICIYICIYSYVYTFLSLIGFYKILIVVSCAIR